MRDLTVPKWLYLSPASRYHQPADELRSVFLLRLSSPLRSSFSSSSSCFFPSSPIIPQMATQQPVLSSEEPHFAKNKPIALAPHLVIRALCSSASYFLFFSPRHLCQRFHFPTNFTFGCISCADAQQNHFFSLFPPLISQFHVLLHFRKHFCD